MACMEHECKCGFFTINNEARMQCPNCSDNCHSLFDEQFDHLDNGGIDYEEEESIAMEEDID